MGGNQGKDGYDSDGAGRDRQYRFAFGSGNHGFSRSADAPQLEEAPEDWARTLNNFGAALYMKGHQSGSTEILSPAAQIFRSALSTWPRALMPMEWARANHNLGLAILAIEEITPSLANALLASGAFARALEIKPWVEMKISQH
jgi:hypothetical protein